MNTHLKAFMSTILLVAVSIAAGLLVYWLLFPLFSQQWQLWLTAIAAAIVAAVSLFRTVFGVMGTTFRELLGVQEAASSQGWTLNPLRPITPKEILAGMGHGGHVPWIDREATLLSHLCPPHGRVIITGGMKLGKTREAAELLRRAVNQNRVPEERIYEPGPAFYVLSDESLRTAFRLCLDPTLPTLLFLDDFATFSTHEGLGKVDEALAMLEACPAGYVVATARTDELRDEHWAWLKQKSFQIVKLPGLDEEETGRLVDEAAGALEMQIDDSARAAFVSEGDGTPELILVSLRQLRAEGVTCVDGDTAQRLARRGLREACAEVRRYIVQREEGAGYFLAALATFHAAQVPAYTPLVQQYAAHFLRGAARWRRPWLPARILRQTLDYLGNFDILASGGELVYPDAIVEGTVPTETAEAALAAFLKQHRRALQQPGLRQLHCQAEAHMRALSALGWSAQAYGEYQTASDLYSAALRVQPHSLIYLARGFTFLKQKDYQRAVADYQRAAELEPNCSLTYNNRGIAHTLAKDYEQAIADYDRVIELEPEYATAYTNRGSAHAIVQDYPRAIADFNRALELDPQDAAAYRNRGGAYTLLRDYPRAIADCDRAIELDPEDAVAYRNRGNVYVELQSYRQAISDYDQALELSPGDATAYNNRGFVYVKLQDYEQAIADFGRAMELRPGEAEAYIQRGNAHAFQGNLLRALADYHRAINLDPESALAFSNRGLAYYRLQDHEQAIADFDRALELSPGDATAYNNRAMTYLLLQDYEQAIADFDRAIGPDAGDASAYYNRGFAYYNLQDYRRAIADCDRAIDLNPKDAIAYSYRGLAYAKLQDYPRAIADYDQAINLDPENALACYSKACAYALISEVRPACAWLEKAVGLYEAWRQHAATDPSFDAIRNEARFIAVMRGRGNYSLSP